MEEIEVGDYVRIDNDFRVIALGIGKVIKINQDTIYVKMKFDMPFSFERKNIVKHSKNIIDLIEEGDYVNGVEVEDLADGIHLKFANDVSFVDVGLCTYRDGHVEGIETIVTKEQFNSIAYRLEE